MNILGICGISIICCVIFSMLKRYLSEYSLIFIALIGIIILIYVLNNVIPLIKKFNFLMSESGFQSEYLEIIFKSMGICLLTQFVSDFCRDACETSLANNVELAGKVFLILTVLPMIEKIFKVVTGLICAK